MDIEAGWVAATCAVVAAVITCGALVRRNENRMTIADAACTDALQTAAEAAEEGKKIAADQHALEKELIEVADRVRREIGGTLTAMQTKIHEFETWSRDEFVRKQSLEALLSRTEKAQEARDDRLDKRLDRIEQKLDEATAFRSQ